MIRSLFDIELADPPLRVRFVHTRISTCDRDQIMLGSGQDQHRTLLTASAFIVRYNDVRRRIFALIRLVVAQILVTALPATVGPSSANALVAELRGIWRAPFGLLVHTLFYIPYSAIFTKCGRGYSKIDNCDWKNILGLPQIGEVSFTFSIAFFEILSLVIFIIFIHFGNFFA